MVIPVVVVVCETRRGMRPDLLAGRVCPVAHRAERLPQNDKVGYIDLNCWRQVRGGTHDVVVVNKVADGTLTARSGGGGGLIFGLHCHWRHDNTCLTLSLMVLEHEGAFESDLGCLFSNLTNTSARCRVSSLLAMESDAKQNVSGSLEVLSTKSAFGGAFTHVTGF